MSDLNSSFSAAALTRLRTAQYYAFDLDDTLHNFRFASGAATKAVLEVVQKDSNHTLEELQTEYKGILTRATASAFTSGKTSHQYREERFQHLIDAFDIPFGDGKMKSLVKLYERVLMKNLQLKESVIELFKTLKRYGHKIAIITEGPQDAQERTIKALGIGPFVDYLATTNQLGVAKVDGLFVKVLETLQLQPQEVVVVGDSWERDILPAREIELYCIHYSENGSEHEESDGVGRISSHEQLRALVERAHREGEA